MSIGMIPQKLKYAGSAKLCYMDMDGFILHVKPEFFKANFQMLRQDLRLSTMKSRDNYL